MEDKEIGINRLYRHVDGGLYRTLGFFNMKMDSGEWKCGIRYIDITEDDKECGTTLKRFSERFIPEFRNYENQAQE